jgi:hypothetical protein
MGATCCQYVTSGSLEPPVQAAAPMTMKDTTAIQMFLRMENPHSSGWVLAAGACSASSFKFQVLEPWLCK